MDLGFTFAHHHRHDPRGHAEQFKKQLMRKGNPSRPIVLLFIVLTSAIILFRRSLVSYGFDTDVLLIGNIVLWVISMVSYRLQANGLKSPGTASFLGGVYGSFILKFLVVAAGVFGYGYLSGGRINKPALFSLMGLYLVYTFLETRALMKLSKKLKNGKEGSTA
jgi:hypothetical protein